MAKSGNKNSSLSAPKATSAAEREASKGYAGSEINAPNDSSDHSSSSSDEASASSEESSTDYSSEDSDAEFATPTVDAAILRTIAKIQAKDPSIYESKSSVYDELEKAAQESSAPQQQQHQGRDKAHKEKPLTLKDMERMRLLGQQKPAGTVHQPTPAEAEAALRAETRAAFHQDEDDSGAESGDEDDDDNLLQVRAKTSAEDEEEDPAMRALVESTLATDDAFLRDFILKRGWVDKTKSALPTHEQIVGKDRAESEFEGPTGANAVGPGYKPLPGVDDDEDLDFEDKAEEYETKYNFRFEEGGADQVVSHDRHGDSVRRADDTRKKEREAKKERKEAKKASKANEIARLKAAKRAEILSKLGQIQAISGHQDMAGMDLEGDFDEEQHAKMMQSMFDDDWYGQEDNGTDKPDWQDDIDTAAYEQEEEAEAAAGEDEAYDPTSVSAPKKKSKKERQKDKKEKKKEKESAAASSSTSANAVAGPSALATSEAVDQTEQTLEALPEEQKAKVQKELDEYYGLDYEDMIEDMPTRFKYTEVEPETYGLSATDILMLTDKELNAYVSLKKLAPYRSEGSGGGGRGGHHHKDKTQGKKLRDLRKATGARSWGNALPMSRTKQVDLSKYSANAGSGQKRKRGEDGAEGDQQQQIPKKRMGKKERQKAKAAAAATEST